MWEGGERKKAEGEEGQELKSVEPTVTPFCRRFAASTFASGHYLARGRWAKKRPQGGPLRRLRVVVGRATWGSWKSVRADARRQDGAVSETRLRYAPKDRSRIFAVEHEVERHSM